ncbi:MAG: NYN domain-containing protein [Vicinamibacterales bacterium]
MFSTDDKLKIAVFIDFDNVEIGVKTTIGGQFDIGLVLEAIKERGEIVTKVAYSDWKRVGDYSRQLTQHAIRMVQRNFTPGGDKNGADITMALDALEMAFTHDHINAFVIVGGDSDFISLVEKLKQYDRKVIVVGGRNFTSTTMQKNCHEFIAYENLVVAARSAQGAQARQPRGGRDGRPQAQAPGGGAPIEQALPLVLRALKVLSEREVTPQLGLLKSTLLQLDSTFSERSYGTGSFRDFMEKVAAAGAVTLKQAGRSMLVEAREDGEGVAADAAADVPVVAPADEGVEGAEPQAAVRPVQQSSQPPQHGGRPQQDGDDAPAGPAPAATEPPAEALRILKRVLANVTRWPMYVRQVKQALRTEPNFDERRYGFSSPVELLRAAQREGIVRIDRDRQGVMRVFEGATLRLPVPIEIDEDTLELAAAPAGVPVSVDVVADGAPAEPVVELPTIEMAPVQEFDEPEPGDEQPTHDLYGDDMLRKPVRGRRPAPGRGRKPAAPAAKPAGRTAAKAAAPKARKRTSRSKA